MREETKRRLLKLKKYVKGGWKEREKYHWPWHLQNKAGVHTNGIWVTSTGFHYKPLTLLTKIHAYYIKLVSFVYKHITGYIKNRFTKYVLVCTYFNVNYFACWFQIEIQNWTILTFLEVFLNNNINSCCRLLLALARI